MTFRELVGALEQAANRAGWESSVWMQPVGPDVRTACIWSKPVGAGPKAEWQPRNKAAHEGSALKERKEPKP